MYFSAPAPTILIYHDRESKTHLGNLPYVLEQAFKPSPVIIQIADRHNFAEKITRISPRIIILPEILGEESFYSRHVSAETQTMIKNFVKSGGMVVTACASTYWMAQSILYNPPKGVTKIRHGQHVFNAAALKAYGPVPGYGRPSNGKPDLGGCVPIELVVKTANGIESDQCWYGNGPALYPIKNQPIPNNVEILARYRNVEDQPIAACVVYDGHGQYLMSGPLPYYHCDPVKPDNALWRVMTHRMHQQLSKKTAEHRLKAAYD